MRGSVLMKRVFVLFVFVLLSGGGAFLFAEEGGASGGEDSGEAQQSSELLDNIIHKLPPSGDSGAEAGAAGGVEKADGGEDDDGDAPGKTGGGEDEDGEDGEEDLDEWLKTFSGPLTTVIYDKETDTRYIVYESDDEVIEYYDFAHIKDYNSLTYILMKLLYRIKKDNFSFASRFSVEYGDFSLPTLVYIRKKNDPTVAYGQLVYPKFRVELSASTKKDARHPLDFRNPKMMQNIVFTFVVQILPEIEEHVGTENFNIERFLGVDLQKQPQGNTD